MLPLCRSRPVVRHLYYRAECKRLSLRDLVVRVWKNECASCAEMCEERLNVSIVRKLSFPNFSLSLSHPPRFPAPSTCRAAVPLSPATPALPLPAVHAASHAPCRLPVQALLSFSYYTTPTSQSR